MKFKTVHYFDAPLELVLKSREARYTEIEKIPDLKSVQEIEREVQGDIIKSKRESSASSLIPPTFRKFVTADMLKWIEESEWNTKTNVHKWCVRPLVPSKYKDKVKDSQEFFVCVGQTKYEEIEENGVKKTRRTLEGDLTVKIPFIGKMAEAAIIEAFKKNAEKDVAAIKERIKKFQKEEQK